MRKVLRSREIFAIIINKHIKAQIYKMRTRFERCEKKTSHDILTKLQAQRHTTHACSQARTMHITKAWANARKHAHRLTHSHTRITKIHTYHKNTYARTHTLTTPAHAPIRTHTHARKHEHSHTHTKQVLGVSITYRSNLRPWYRDRRQSSASRSC